MRNLFSGTMAGLLALFFWSLTIGVSRSLMEKIGVFTAGSLIFSLAGLLSCLSLFVGKNFPSSKQKRMAPGVFFFCGFLFVAYMLCLYAGIGLASSKVAVLTVALLNYLWPTFIILFSVVLLACQVNWLIWPGISLATSGTYLALTTASGIPVKEIAKIFHLHNPVFLFGLGAGMTWGLYSVVTRKFGQESASGLPFYLLATGLVLGLLRYFFPEESHWSVSAWGELSFMVLFPTILAYSLWETGIRRGNFRLLSTASYLVPVVSTFASCLYLSIRPEASIWIASFLVAAGAFVCHLAFREGW
ncbi:MAG: aromatic amino acid DMT transporter YddG [Candidatus Omnitrophica bacterium]|nr:aromatic amino acid DMT transporter YddG [Candidatus Omnitrophota bacterium]